MAQRKKWVDVLRGLAVLFVIFGHIANPLRVYMMATAPVKIPMFFAITGYVFNENKNAKNFFLNLFWHIVIPWLIMSLLWIIVPLRIYKEGVGSAIQLILSYVSGEHLWYIPCCIVSEILFYYLLKLIRHDYVRYAVIICIAIFGYILSQNNLANFMMFDIACTSLFFMLIGRVFGQNEEGIRDFATPVKIVIFAGIYLAMCCYSIYRYPGKAIDVHHNSYYSPLLCLIMILIGLVTLFVAAPYFQNLKWLKFVGQNTLIFYIMHYHARSVYAKAISIMNVRFQNEVLSYIAEFIFVCITMTIASLVINRYFPFVVGKRAKGSTR